MQDEAILYLYNNDIVFRLALLKTSVLGVVQSNLKIILAARTCIFPRSWKGVLLQLPHATIP